jgi:tryptophan 2,3-dioxygenase
MSNKESIIKAIETKYEQLGENPMTYLEGLQHAKALNYWDYIEVDTLLSLQKPRTVFEDEEIFIMYHQVTELMLKLVLHEIKQITGDNQPDLERLETKLKRVNRYTGMLINSFAIMSEGMDYDDYNQFRKTLAPASGFQSAQFRFIELRCTRIENLINQEGRKRLPVNPSIEDYFEHIYWKDAGLNRKTGEKTLTLRQFEEKYLDSFIRLAKVMQGKTLEDKIMTLGDNMPDSLKIILRKFDYSYNIKWPLVHLNTARHYLDAKGETKAATGGSEWKKYLHPEFQQRKFFPIVWGDEEISNWGKESKDL